MTNEELIKKFYAASKEADYNELYLYLDGFIGRRFCSTTKLILYKYIDYAIIKKEKNVASNQFFDAAGQPLAQGDFVSTIVLNHKSYPELGFGIVRNFLNSTVFLLVGTRFVKDNLSRKHKVDQILKLSPDTVYEIAKEDFQLVSK